QFDHVCAQEPVTVKGISPRVIWPSGASTCHRIRYAPGFNPMAFEFRVSGEVCVSMGKSLVELSGFSNCNFDSFASIRTLYFSITGTSGPVTLLFATGRVSLRIACPSISPASSRIAPTNAKPETERNFLNALLLILPLSPPDVLFATEHFYKYSRMSLKKQRVACDVGNWAALIVCALLVSQGFDGIQFGGLHRG